MECAYFSDLFKNRIFPSFLNQLKAEGTRKNYYSAVVHLCNHVGKDFLLISAADAREYFSKFETGAFLKPNGKCYSSSTVSLKLFYFRSISTYILQNAVLFGMEDYTSPFTFLEAAEPVPVVNATEFPSLTLIDRLLSVADAQMRLILALTIRCGLTTSEIVSLTPAHLSYHDGLVDICFRSVTNKKNDRIVHVPEDVSELLTSYLSMTGVQPTVFCNIRRKPLTSRVLENMFHRLKEDAGIDTQITLQKLRTMNICYMLAGGATPEAVSSQLGISERWMHRYKNAADDVFYRSELDQASEYSHLRIVTK